MKNIRIVVASQFDKEENILGYILPELPDYLQILHASIFRGATANEMGGSIALPKNIREATSEDFNTFRISEIGFNTNLSYEYKRIK